ncbi:hypothetical protein N2152v2_006557 [Parachlorella kessleri]
MGSNRQIKQGGEQWKHAVAGCTAGLASVLALQPLDVIKTRLQVQDGAGALPLYRGTLDAVRRMLQEEGWRALYAGLTPALIGSGVAWGAYFYTYNRAKERYLRRAAVQEQQQLVSLHQQPGKAVMFPPAVAQQQQQQVQQRLSPGMHLISAAEAGALVCLLTNPIWVVKTRLQLQRGGTLAGQQAAAGAKLAGSALTAAAGVAAAPGGNYRGFVDALTQIARQEGVRGLYKGLLPSLLLVSHGAIQLAVYEELKSLAQSFQGFSGSSIASLSNGSSSGLTSSSSGGNDRGGHSSSGTNGNEGSSRRGGGQAQRTLTSAEITAFGALSKMAASIATYPSQVVRSRLQQRMDAGRALRYTGVGDVLRKTLAREGVGGFYKGLVPNVLRVMPQSAVTFLVYESVMRYLSERGSSPAVA